MTRATHSDAVWSIDDLELELRKLPGVRAAGFHDLDDMLLVQLHVAEAEPTEKIDRSERADQPVPVTASRIAARHSDRPVAVEVVRWRTATLVVPTIVAAPAETETGAAPEVAAPETTTDESGQAHRCRLLAVLAFPDTDELEVHLILDGKRTIGRAPVSAGIEGACEATLEAIRELGTGIDPHVRWARALDNAGEGDQVVVAVGVDGVDSRAPVHYGLASGTSLIDAASRATLDALNRRLSLGR